MGYQRTNFLKHIPNISEDFKRGIDGASIDEHVVDGGTQKRHFFGNFLKCFNFQFPAEPPCKLPRVLLRCNQKLLSIV